MTGLYNEVIPSYLLSLLAFTYSPAPASDPPSPQFRQADFLSGGFLSNPDSLAKIQSVALSHPGDYTALREAPPDKKVWPLIHQGCTEGFFHGQDMLTLELGEGSARKALDTTTARG